MSELKSFIVLYDGKFIRAYEESEADKVIAELKSEIERLEILCANYRHDCDNLAISNEQAKRAARTLLKKMNHNKYKRNTGNVGASVGSPLPIYSNQTQPSTERRLPMPCNGKKSGGKKPPKK